jgi:hypothetical protein
VAPVADSRGTSSVDFDSGSLLGHAGSLASFAKYAQNPLEEASSVPERQRPSRLLGLNYCLRSRGVREPQQKPQRRVSLERSEALCVTRNGSKSVLSLSGTKVAQPMAKPPRRTRTVRGGLSNAAGG